MDDLSTGAKERVSSDARLEVGSLLDEAAMTRIFNTYDIDGVVHLAAKKRVDESISAPLLYFQENVEGLRLLLDRCVHSNVKYFLFSSSASVYGAPEGVAIDERTVCEPVNVYGRTKLVGEWLTHDVGAAHGIRTLALRYFNVAGTASAALADTEGENLVPRTLRALARNESPTIFGDDYPTADGTCVRDYIHVTDVADAHVSAAEALVNGRAGRSSLNIGTGRGVSVRELIDVARSVTGRSIEPIITPRRQGDPPAVVAAVDSAREMLGWKAKLDVADMVESAWLAHLGRAAG